MGKIFKANKVVILTTGKYAGKKAVVLRVFEEGAPGRPFAHCLVVGLRKEPGRIKKKDSEKRKLKKCRLMSFIKVCNLNQLMPTRYSLELDLKNAITMDSLENKTKKKESIQLANEKLLEKFKSGTNKWFFAKLLF